MSNDNLLMFWKYMYIKYGKSIPFPNNWTPTETKKYEDAWIVRGGDIPLTYMNMKSKEYLVVRSWETQIYELSDTFIETFL